MITTFEIYGWKFTFYLYLSARTTKIVQKRIVFMFTESWSHAKGLTVQFILQMLTCDQVFFFSGKGEKKNAWYIYLMGRLLPPN